MPISKGGELQVDMVPMVPAGKKSIGLRIGRLALYLWPFLISGWCRERSKIDYSQQIRKHDINHCNTIESLHRRDLATASHQEISTAQMLRATIIPMLPNYHYNIRNQSLVPRKLGTTPVVLVLNAVVLCITSCSRFHVYNAKFILITPPCIEGKGKNHHQLKN